MQTDRTTKSSNLRPEISAQGSFVAIPTAFPVVDPGVRNAVKLEFATVFSEENVVETLFSTDRVLVDLGAVDPTSLDFTRLAKDCDLLKEIAVKYPNELKECLIALQTGGSAGVEKAEEITKRIGLTEEKFMEKGGGFIFIVVLVGIAVGAGACGGALKQVKDKGTIPTPRKPISSGGGETPQ
jgi:hypothetical protein